MGLQILQLNCRKSRSVMEEMAQTMRDTACGVSTLQEIVLGGGWLSVHRVSWCRGQWDWRADGKLIRSTLYTIHEIKGAYRRTCP